MKSINDCPNELIQAIIDPITDQGTLYNLVVTSKRVSRVALPYLYRRFSHRRFLRPNQLHCFLRAVIRNSELALQTTAVELLDPLPNAEFLDLESWRTWAQTQYTPAVHPDDHHMFLNASDSMQEMKDSNQARIVEQEEAQAVLLLCLLKNINLLKVENPVAASRLSRFPTDYHFMALLHPQIKQGLVLQQLAHLHVTSQRMEGGQDGFRLTAIAPFFLLPKLTKVSGNVCHEPEDEDFLNFDCPPNASNVSHLSFERSAICPVALQMMFMACKRVEVFECDWAGVVLGWVEINFPHFKEGIYSHRRHLKRLRLDTRKHFDSWRDEYIGLIPPLGSLQEYTSLTSVELPASALIGWDEDGVGNYDRLQDSLPPNIEELAINQMAPRLYEHISALADVCSEKYPRLAKITISDDDWDEDLRADLKNRFVAMGAHVEIELVDGSEVDHFS